MALKRHDTEAVYSDPDGTDKFGIGLLDDAELLELRGLIDQRLEIKHIGAIDLGHEVMIQLRTLKLLQHKAMTEPGTPVNQQAQAANTVSKMLQDLVKSRSKLYSAERIKQVEEMTIEAMKGAPEEAKLQFFESLEKMLATLPTLATLLEESE